MTDQPNLKQFLDEMGSFSDEAGAPGKAAAPSALPPIGHVVEIAGSGSQIRLDAAALASSAPKSAGAAPGALPVPAAMAPSLAVAA